MTYSIQANVYSRIGLTSAQLPNVDMSVHQASADAKIDEMFGKQWSNAQSVTEIIDTLDEPVDTNLLGIVSINPPPIDRIFLSKTPIQAITSFVELDVDGNVVITHTSTDYWLDPNLGMITLREATFVSQRNRCQVVYTYGYITVPILIRTLAEVMSAITALTEHHGINWERPGSVSIPNVSESVGITGNILDTMRTLEKEKDELINILGRRKRNFFVI